MSQTVGATVTFEVPYATEHIAPLLAALKAAVEENWAPEHHDAWSHLVPYPHPEPEAWLARLRTEEMLEIQGGEAHGPGGYIPPCHLWLSPTFGFAFSPLSASDACVNFSYEEDQRLRVHVSTSQRAIYEQVGHREAMRMDTESWDDPSLLEDEVWLERRRDVEDLEGEVGERNRRFLLHLVERLKAVHPVREVDLDADLSDV